MTDIFFKIKYNPKINKIVKFQLKRLLYGNRGNTNPSAEFKAYLNTDANK